MSRVAVVFRSYAKSSEVVPEVVSRALVSARAATTLMAADGTPVFQEVLFLVPTDYDCGETVTALKKLFDSEGVSARVCGASGHHSCGALNVAVELAHASQCSVVTIISNKAIGYLTSGIMVRALEEINANSAMVGVEIPELSVVSPVPINNTFAVWDVQKLMSVGMFETEVGVEEMAPIGRLVEKGETLSLIASQGETSLTLRQSTDGQARHSEVKNTKTNRQLDELARVGVSLEQVLSSIKTISL